MPGRQNEVVSSLNSAVGFLTAFFLPGSNSGHVHDCHKKFDVMRFDRCTKPQQDAVGGRSISEMPVRLLKRFPTLLTEEGGGNGHVFRSGRVQLSRDNAVD